MPSGYTAPLYEGKEISFEEFMLRCARADGSAIMLRDHDADVLPTEENVVDGSDYEQRDLARMQEELARLSVLSFEEIAGEHQEAREQTRAMNRETVEKCTALRDRYEKMLAKVDAWQPPTEDHVWFKEFVAKQISESIDFDAKPYLTDVDTLSDDEWQRERLERISSKIEWSKRRIEERQERNRGRVEWVRALRESLEGVKA